MVCEDSPLAGGPASRVVFTSSVRFCDKHEVSIGVEEELMDEAGVVRKEVCRVDTVGIIHHNRDHPYFFLVLPPPPCLGGCGASCISEGEVS